MRKSLQLCCNARGRSIRGGLNLAPKAFFGAIGALFAASLGVRSGSRRQIDRPYVVQHLQFARGVLAFFQHEALMNFRAAAEIPRQRRGRDVLDLEQAERVAIQFETLEIVGEQDRAAGRKQACRE